MSSITLGYYKQQNINDTYIEYYWDKYIPHFWVIVGKKYNELIHIIWKKSYMNVESAKRSFKRQITKAKKGDYNV